MVVLADKEETVLQELFDSLYTWELLIKLSSAAAELPINIIIKNKLTIKIFVFLKMV